MSNPNNKKIQTIWYNSQSYKNYIASLEKEQQKIDEERKNKPQNFIKKIYSNDSEEITPVVFPQYWENFNKGDSDTITSIGNAITDIHTFILQKNKLWDANTTAWIELFNGVQYWHSNSSTTATITTKGAGSTVAHSQAYGGTLGFHPGTALSGFDAFAYGSSLLSGAEPIIIPGSGITKFPCMKIIHNEKTDLDDIYHLFIKADCIVSVSASGGSVVDSEIQYEPILFTQEEIDAWNSSPVLPNPYHTCYAEVRLIIATTRGTGMGGTTTIFTDGAYHVSTGIPLPPLVGIPTNLNNFDIDLALVIPNPLSEYITNVKIESICQGWSNSFDVKAGPAVFIFNFWRGQKNRSGGFTDCAATFTIDNIKLYYKKV